MRQTLFLVLVSLCALTEHVVNIESCAQYKLQVNVHHHRRLANYYVLSVVYYARLKLTTLLRWGKKYYAQYNTQSRMIVDKYSKCYF